MKATPIQRHIVNLQFGFVTSKDMPVILALDPLQPLLVRCGACRFVCGAQYLEHMMRCVGAGGDYVRDVSIPADHMAAARAAVLEDRQDSEAQCVRDRARRLAVRFNEADCGGAFDGSRVTSDADPGL